MENQVITTELAKQNVTEQVIAKLKADFLPLKINGIDDKEGYKKVKAARLQCRDVRVLAEKICKRGREDAVKTQKEWIAKEKEIVAQVSEVESYLKKQEDAIDNEIEAQKIRAERLLKLPERKEQIIGVESYFLIELNDEIIMGFDDPTWNNLVLMAKQKKIDEFELKERIKKEQELTDLITKRVNILFSKGAKLKIVQGVRWIVKGKESVTEGWLGGAPEEVFEGLIKTIDQIEDELPATNKPESASDVKQYPKTPSESYKAPEGEGEIKASLPGEYRNDLPGGKLVAKTDDEKLWDFAKVIEGLVVPILNTEAGKATFKRAEQKLAEAIEILQS